MATNKEFEKIGNLFNKKTAAKPPAYQWQDLALRVIKELSIPDVKKAPCLKLAKKSRKISLKAALTTRKNFARQGISGNIFLS